jgi:PAS domain-containing protein
LAIDLAIQKLQESCTVLNEFALPRAIVDFDRHSFVAWNSRFLEQTGFSEDEIKSSKPEELLIFGEAWFPLSEERQGQKVEYIPCSGSRSKGANFTQQPEPVHARHVNVGQYEMRKVILYCIEAFRRIPR